VPPVPEEVELSALKLQAGDLERALNDVQDRIRELEKADTAKEGS
jgi:hypothetical protein